MTTPRPGSSHGISEDPSAPRATSPGPEVRDSGRAVADPDADESGNTGGAFGFVAKLLLVGTPFLLAALFLFLDWWLR